VFGQFDRVRPFDVDSDGFTEVSRRELQASGFRLNRYQLTGRAKLTFDLTHVREDRRGGDSLHLPPDQALVAESIDSSRLALSGTWFHSVSRRFDYRVTASTADTGATATTALAATRMPSVRARVASLSSMLSSITMRDATR